MQAKNVLYAAVGAPVLAARKMTDQVNELKGRVSKETANYSEAANRAIDGWAAEGEKVVSRISEGKVVEEISQKVDLDQAKEQVGKLRDQLEDMLATWRSSFRPEKAAGATKAAATSEPTDKTAAKPAEKKSPAKKPADKTSAAKTTSAKAKSSTTAKTSTAKSNASKAKAS